MKRRTYLGLAGATTVSLAGCFAILGGNDDDDDEDSSDSSTDENTNTNSENENEPETAENEHNRSESDESNTTSEDTPDDNESREEPTEGATENESEKPERPSDEELEPDRSQYDDSDGPTQASETKALPESSVSVSTEVKKSGYAYTVHGTVHNETSNPIDFVDIEIEWLDANGTTVGESVGVVRNIPAGGSGTFSLSVSEASLRGTPETIEGTAYPQNYVEN